ncbi:MAG: GHMP kinase [Pseudomonadota bacterium]
MIYITRTPLRVSLFGGGTDYPAYFERRPGAVIGLTIDKYIYIGALRLTSYQAYNYRISYSIIELCKKRKDIQHPVIREVLNYLDAPDRLDINVISDLPASGSGLGSSSSFTVGFLNLIYTLQQQAKTKIDLARDAIKIERDILAENVGIQDQLHATFGGLNRYDFVGSDLKISPLQIASSTMRQLSDSMVLIHTGKVRRATAIADEQVNLTKEKKLDKDLSYLFALVDECCTIIEKGGDDFLIELGRMLSESWYIKRNLTSSISSDDINAIFNKIIETGAYGAKLCGAGGGGYFLALYPHGRISELAAVFGADRVIPIEIETTGSSIVQPVNQALSW